MKLVIEIPKGLYYSVVDGFAYECNIALSEAFKNGTPLPKGHGRLINAEVFASNVVKYSHQSTKTIGQALADTPTIIEADKAESDEQEKVDDYRDRLDELEREEYYESKYGKEQE